MKKVICIKDFTKNHEAFGELILSNIYTVLAETTDYYTIENENGYECI